MTPIRAVIVDDEPSAREVVRAMLADHAEVQIVGEATNGSDAIEVIRRVRPDLVFLDVQMPDGDGFGVLDDLGEQVPRGVVFVTAHDEHAIRAFEVHALDYVLKPFGRQRFSAAVGRALERLNALDALTLQRTLASMADDRRAGRTPEGELAVGAADAPGALHRRIAVRNGAKLTLVDVGGIDWVEADGDYARIHTGKHTHLVSYRMHALERLLETGGFIRIHRSLIVNSDRVQELHREGDGSGFIVLKDGVRLRVARGRWEALEKALQVEEM
jgi:two-component system LytT family response regulator